MKKNDQTISNFSNLNATILSLILKIILISTKIKF